MPAAKVTSFLAGASQDRVQAPFVARQSDELFMHLGATLEGGCSPASASSSHQLQAPCSKIIRQSPNAAPVNRPPRAISGSCRVPLASGYCSCCGSNSGLYHQAAFDEGSDACHPSQKPKFSSKLWCCMVCGALACPIPRTLASMHQYVIARVKPVQNTAVMKLAGVHWQKCVLQDMMRSVY